MNRNDAIAHLTRCSDPHGNHWYQGRVWSDPATCPTCKGTDDAGHLRCPGSRYGHTSAHVAAVVWKYCQITSRDGEYTDLDYAMSLAVNDSPVLEDDMRRYAIGLSGADVDDIVEGYLEAQLWSQLDYTHPDDAGWQADGGNYGTLDENYDRDDVSPEYVETVHAEISALVVAHPLAVRMYLTQRRYDASEGSVSSYFGHDFYLTREGHGAGFWDRGLRNLGDYLTQVSKWAGPAADLGDNGDGVLVP